MPTINQLCRLDPFGVADLLVAYASNQGDARSVSGQTLLNFIQGNITSVDDFITQYAAPSATGFSVSINGTVTPQNQSVWLVLTPVADYAAGTILLPPVANCQDKQELLVNTTHAVTTLTVSGNGATVTGAPTTIAANGFFRLRFDGVTKTWYRVG